MKSVLYMPSLTQMVTWFGKQGGEWRFQYTAGAPWVDRLEYVPGEVINVCAWDHGLSKGQFDDLKAGKHEGVPRIHGLLAFWCMRAAADEQPPTVQEELRKRIAELEAKVAALEARNVVIYDPEKLKDNSIVWTGNPKMPRQPRHWVAHVDGACGDKLFQCEGPGCHMCTSGLKKIEVMEYLK